MLKPRYGNVKDAVADFKSLLGELDVRHPKDPTLRTESRQEPKPAAKPAPEGKPRALAEHAPLSRYTSQNSALQSFRVLAGLEERDVMPWDSGVVGTTRHTKNIMSDVLNESQSSTEDLILENMLARQPLAEDMSPEERSHAEVGEKSWSGAHALHKHVMAKHYIKQHETIPGMHPDKKALHLSNMADERRHASKWLKHASDKALGSGDRKSAIKFAHWSRLHAHAGHHYEDGIMPKWEEEDLDEVMDGGY